MSGTPWLTVVTVVRNDADGLRGTLASVAEQDAEGVEQLIVDGASTDDTAEVARAAVARDPYVRLISEPDDGIYDAMNKGWRAARGTTVQFLNAGDVYRTAGELRAVRDRLELTPTPWLRTRVRWVDAAGTPTRPLESGRITPAGFWWGWQPVAHQGAFLGRELLEQLGGFSSRYRIVADHDFMRRALAAGVRPVVWDRVTVNMQADGVSTQRYAQGFREMHASRSAGRSLPVRAASRADATVHTAVVAARRTMRWTAEQALGRQRVGRIRGGG